MDIWDQFQEDVNKAGAIEFLRYEDIEGVSIIGTFDRVITAKSGNDWIVLTKAQIRYPVELPSDEKNTKHVHKPTRPIALSKTVAWLQYEEGVAVKDRSLLVTPGTCVGVFVGKIKKLESGNFMRDLTVFPMKPETIDQHADIKAAHEEQEKFDEHGESVEASQTSAVDF